MNLSRAMLARGLFGAAVGVELKFSDRAPGAYHSLTRGTDPFGVSAFLGKIQRCQDPARAIPALRRCSTII